jgi:hypothetical protein
LDRKGRSDERNNHLGRNGPMKRGDIVQIEVEGWWGGNVSLDGTDSTLDDRTRVAGPLYDPGDADPPVSGEILRIDTPWNLQSEMRTPMRPVKSDRLTIDLSTRLIVPVWDRDGSEAPLPQDGSRYQLIYLDLEPKTPWRSKPVVLLMLVWIQDEWELLLRAGLGDGSSDPLDWRDTMTIVIPEAGRYQWELKITPEFIRVDTSNGLLAVPNPSGMPSVDWDLVVGSSAKADDKAEEPFWQGCRGMELVVTAG